MALDKYDKRIVAALQADARISIPDLAIKVGLSDTPCRRRIKRLEENGVLLRYAAVVSPRAMGLAFEGMVRVTLEDHAETVVAPFETTMRNRFEVVACYALAGEADFLVHIRTHDQDAFNEFVLNVLRRLSGVLHVRSSLIMRTVKTNLEWTIGAIGDHH